MTKCKHCGEKIYDVDEFWYHSDEGMWAKCEDRKHYAEPSSEEEEK